MLRYKRKQIGLFQTCIIHKRWESKAKLADSKLKSEILTVPSKNDEVDLVSYNRHLKVFEMLTDKSKRFQYSAPACLEIYKNEDSTFLGDLSKHPLVNKELFDFICENYWKSSSIRALVLHDLLKTSESKNHQLASQIYKKIVTHEDIIGFKVSTDVMGHHQLCSSLVSFAAKSGEPLIAALFLLKFRSIVISHDKQIFKVVLGCLMQSREQNNQYCNYVLLKLVNAFPEYQYSSKEISDILEFSLKGRNDCYFANLLFEKLLSRMKLFNNDTSLSHCLSKLILANISYTQYDRAMSIYKKLKDFKFVRENIGVQIKLATHFKEFSLSLSDQSNSKIVDFLIKYYCDDEVNLKNILNTLGGSIKRSTLSSLFYTFSVRGSEKEAERILQSINKSNSGINHEDLNLIILSHLVKENVDDAITIAQESNVLISKSAYISIFKYILENKLTFGYKGFIRTMGSQLQKIKGDQVLFQLVPSFVQYLSNHYHYLTGKVFLVSLMKTNRHYTWQDRSKIYDLSKHSVPNTMYQSFPINNENLIESIQLILNSAVTHEDLETIRWCIQELRLKGVLLKDILKRIKGCNSQLFNTVFDGKIKRLI